MKTQLAIAFLLSVISVEASAGFVAMDSMIKNLHEQKAQLRKQLELPLVMPAILPAKSNIHGFILQTNAANNYQIYFSENGKCRGAKDCTLATITAEKGGMPQIAYGMNHKKLTHSVTINHLEGFYTPSYAIGSTSPAEIAFRCNNVLYTMSWNHGAKNDKDILMGLAKSMVASEPSCK